MQIFSTLSPIAQKAQIKKGCNRKKFTEGRAGDGEAGL
jgi:hypothetical protein